jgi:hypothetical protein
MIISQLDDSDMGKWVHYWPRDKYGRIKSWNDEWIFVVYKCDKDWDNFQNYTAVATNPKDLQFVPNDWYLEMSK